MTDIDARPRRRRPLRENGRVAAEDALLEEVTRTRDQLREEARATLGITGDATGDERSMRETLRAFGLSWYPLATLGVLSIVDTFFTYAFEVLTPEISRGLGVGKGVIALAIAVKTLSIAIAPLPMAAFVQRRPRRAAVSIVTGIAWSVVAISTAFVVNIWGLLFVLVLDGLSTGSVRTVHEPLLVDHYPPTARVRSLSYYQASNSFGNVLAPLLVAGLTAYLGISWRGAFLALGVLSLVAALSTIRLRDPGFGRWDTQQIRRNVHRHHGEVSDRLTDDDVELGFFEIVRRLFLIPTIRRLLVAATVLGIMLIPYQTFLFFFLEERWNMGPGARGVFFAFTAATSVVALALFAKRGEDLYRRSPAAMVRRSGDLLAISVLVFALGSLVDQFALMVGLFAIGTSLLAILPAALAAPLLGVIPAQMRPHASALTGIFIGGVGGVTGALFLSGIESRFGTAGAIASLVVPGVMAGLLLRSSARFVEPDIDRMIDEVLEDEEIRRIESRGGKLPMLACRGIDFSYGQLQVLFDVDFTVDDGEMVALLGVNGAGKSTLLRVVSGLGLPTKGSVRYRGADITYLDAERRLRHGITQVPGGRAVFGPMSVVDNLRAFGYSLRHDRRAVDVAMERSFEAFPRLAERRNQPASTLSGGEQQMLGLAKALMLQPKLLLIDELSLGLAPVIVGQLLDMVREINRDGTAVVLVEQSVNIALNLVDHAYFMEKGQIRFDGRSDELLARDDLLRAVFLEGAGSRDATGAP